MALSHMQPPCWREQQLDAALQALSVALEQPSFGQDANVICTLLQVCRSWRATAQRSSSGLLAVSFQGGLLTSKMGSALRSISSLTTWIARYPGLVNEVRITFALPSSDDEVQSFATAAEYLFADSIKQAVSGGLDRGRTAATTCTTLKLRSFSAVKITRTALLEVLPVTSLTKLSIDVLSDKPCSSRPAAWAAAVGRLTALQELDIECLSKSEGTQLHGLLAHSSNLQRLTYLDVRSYNMADDCLQHLPQTLRVLKLHSCCFETSADGSILTFQHLTNLVQLNLDVCSDVMMLSAAPLLPTQLQELNINKEMLGESCLPSVGVWNLTGLQQLTKLVISHNTHLPQDLIQLAVLPGLESVELSYHSAIDTLAAAPGWKQLPQLDELSVLWEQDDLDNVSNTQTLDGLLPHIATVCTLQRLYLALCASVNARLEVCSYLTGLTRLKSLSLGGLGNLGALAYNDALHLTALTKLTRLHFGEGCSSGVGDMVAVALACQLTNLVEWSLSNCGLTTAAVLPAIQLHQKQLIKLWLNQNDHDFTDEEVAVLSPTVKKIWR